MTRRWRLSSALINFSISRSFIRPISNNILRNIQAWICPAHEEFQTHLSISFPHATREILSRNYIDAAKAFAAGGNVKVLDSGTRGISRAGARADAGKA